MPPPGGEVIDIFSAVRTRTPIGRDRILSPGRCGAKERSQGIFATRLRALRLDGKHMPSPENAATGKREHLFSPGGNARSDGAEPCSFSRMAGSKGMFAGYLSTTRPGEFRPDKETLSRMGRDGKIHAIRWPFRPLFHPRGRSRQPLWSPRSFRLPPQSI